MTQNRDAGSRAVDQARHIAPASAHTLVFGDLAFAREPICFAIAVPGAIAAHANSTVAIFRQLQWLICSMAGLGIVIFPLLGAPILQREGK